MNNIVFEELSSTNDFLKKNHRNYKNFDVIIALRQTSGRGRFDRVWESEKDLTFSILTNSNNPLYHMITPLSVIYALKEIGINGNIKWPNDIVVDNKKLAGILIEQIYEGENYISTIIGVGINFSKKEEYSYIKEYSEIEMFDFLNILEEKFLHLLNINQGDILKLYKDYNIVLGKDLEYLGKVYKVIDFTEKGELVLKSKTSIINVNSNEIDIKSSIIKK